MGKLLTALELEKPKKLRESSKVQTATRAFIRSNNYSINRVKVLLEIIRTKKSLLDQFRLEFCLDKQPKKG